jgi:hypothetical protein
MNLPTGPACPSAATNSAGPKGQSPEAPKRKGKSVYALALFLGSRWGDGYSTAICRGFVSSRLGIWIANRPSL